ncbi:MAG TPA: GAF domain-containing protein [Bacteroidia bacterium]|jgi:serine phosphatase RsbU (regulator of sigma subunit)/tetratricopeptide (TPR) repeat protein
MDYKENVAEVEETALEQLITQSLEICRTNPQKGVELADAALKASASLSITAQALACKGACQVWLGDYENALKNLFDSLAQFETMPGSKFESHIFYHIFCAFYFLADYDNALKYASEMLDRAEKSNDINAQANALNGIGSVFYTSGENEKAIEALSKGLLVAEKLEDKHLLARIFDGLGAAYFNINDIEKAIDFKERSLETARPLGLKNVESYALDGLARIYMAANAFKIAEKLFLDCLSIREEINFKSGIAETNLHLGDLFLKTEMYDKALPHLEKALAISIETKTKEVIYKTHEALSRYYEKQANTEKFIEHFKNYFTYKEEYFSEKNKQKLKGVEMQISISQMEKEKALLSEKNKQLELLSNDLVVLSDLGKKIISQLSVENINTTVYAIINELMDAPGFGIGVASEDHKEIIFPGYIENGEVLSSSGYELSDINRLPVLCFNNETEIIINDYELEADNYVQKRLKPTAGESVQSIIYLPLRIADRKIGVLTVQSFNKNAFTEYHVNLVKNLAVYCAIAIENATSYEKLEERVNDRTKEIERSHENTRLLGSIGQQIISSVDFDSIFKNLHENVSQLMNADCFGVRIYEPDKNEIEYRFEMEKGERLGSLSVSMDNIDNFSVWCVRNKKEIFINDNLNEYQKYTSKIVVPAGDMPSSLLFCPMMIGERVVGVITVQSFEKFAYKPLHIDILKTLGTYTAIALENANLVENLEDKVKERTSEVVKQKEIIEETNKHITDSIKYAKRIQEAFLPSESSIAEHLKNAFILYKPKDIVSGDFYWIERKGNKILFAVVDCTGHGVPGAFMSIIGFNGLNQIVNEYNYTRPADILTHLNKSISNTLRQNVEDSKIRDGMDVAICSIDLDNNKLEFAGAFSPLFILRNNEVLKFKGDKHPIGNFVGVEEFEFTNNEIDLLPDDKIYIFSDGFVDQFGGPNGKKLKYNYFRQLLLDNHKRPMPEQKEKINEFFEQWRTGFEQIDDVCIIGVAI